MNVPIKVPLGDTGLKQPDGTQSDDDQIGVGHHGPPVLTERDVYIAEALVQWIQIAQKKYGPTWFPNYVDIQKSRLFWRLRSGKELLEEPPPTAFSCPWYELVEEPDRPHWAYDGHLHEGQIYLAQCRYDLLEYDIETKVHVVAFGSYVFRCWQGPSPHGPFGWYVQRDLQLEAKFKGVSRE
jgi:hypothetical protein